MNVDFCLRAYSAPAYVLQHNDKRQANTSMPRFLLACNEGLHPSNQFIKYAEDDLQLL